MGFRDRIARALGTGPDAQRADGLAELAVGDAAYDGWDIVADYEDLDTARAFRQVLTDGGYETVLTSDWPLDEFGRGDISLRVRPGLGFEADDLLDPAD
jgi:hypothetical protein